MWLPLALFLAGTLASLIFSPEPLHGLPQVKKMFVFAVLLVISSTLPTVTTARRLFLGWGALGTAIACFGLVQFAIKLHEAHVEHQPMYMAYMLARFAGSMSLPITFAGQDMTVLLVLVAFILFGPWPKRRAYGVAAVGGAILIGLILLANGTRTVWIGTAVAGFWLLWSWKKWSAAALPAVVLLVWLVPGPVHDRLRSLYHPRKDVDSNEFRIICVKTGIRMIEAHPLLGIGLDETKYHFLDYLPPDTRRPLPPGFYQHLHDVYLQYAAERGIPTLLMMIWMLLLIVRDFHRSLARLPSGRSDERFLLYAGIATVIGIMVSGVFEVNLGDSEVLTVFLVVVSCGYLVVDQFQAGSIVPESGFALTSSVPVSDQPLAHARGSANPWRY